MRRDPNRLCADRHDVIVVGGGIHGACAAWEAARRGLKVALIEAGDFNQATSSNSLRTFHGGLRHLQRLDLVHMRQSIRARREWLRLAPELSRPLRFVLPLDGHGTKRSSVLRAALWANDLVSADRNRAVGPEHHLPAGAILTRAEFESRYPGLSVTDCKGAAAWYDAVCLNTERLQLAVVAAAVACGAQAANYVRAVQPLARGSAICGVRARDELTGREMDLDAPLVINAAGPWIEEWLGDAVSSSKGPAFRASKAFNLLVRQFPFRDALGLTVTPRGSGRGHGSSTYFIMPWNGYSLVGTRHLRCDHDTRSARVSRDEVLEFLADINPQLGEHRLSSADVHGVFSGLLPETKGNRGADVALERAPRIIDHAEHGLRGMLSVIGVKWTTSRCVGQQVATMACRRLGKPERPTAPRTLAALGAAPSVYTDPTLTPRVVPDQPVVLGQVLHAVREEMAMRLADVVRRRTPLYLSPALDRSALASCAAVMARELRWSRRELAAEIDAAEADLVTFRGIHYASSESRSAEPSPHAAAGA
jgi:glycerol-3-phosphate dehydrogenase